MSSERAHLLDVVKLSHASDGWPAGTEGTVVEAYADGVTVEVSDELGRTLALLDIPYSAVDVVWRLPAGRSEESSA